MTPPLSAWSAIGQVLGPGRRAGLAGLLALMVFGMLLELAGVGLVIPVIQLLSGPVPRSEATLVGHWASLVGARDHAGLVRVTMLCLVIFFAFKLACQALVALRLAAFRYDLQADIARRLYALYLAQPFGFHVRRNSAHLISTVSNEAHDAAQATHHGLALIAELLVICGLAVLLIIASPLAGIAVASLVAVAAWFSLRLTRTGLNAWGVRLRHHQALKMKSLQQGLGGIKLIKLGGLEAAALDHFDGHNLASTAAGRHHATMQALPRLWLEFLAVTGLAALVLLARPPAGDPAGLVPLLALFAAAAFRLIPSANRIINGYQSLRYFGPTIGSVAVELALATPPAPETSGPLPPFERELLVDQVTYGYPGASDPVLDAVTVRIGRGSAVGFAGPSGAGKSTLLDIILGLLTPDSGQVCVDGAPITDNLRDWRGRIGYVPQTIQLADDTIRRNVAFGQADHAISEAAVRAALRMARLEDYVASLPDGLDTVIGEHGARMSGGQRQRLGIARALYGKPSLLVLDEPTSALDPLNEQAIIETLLALRPELTVLIASHRTAALEGCDHVVQMG